MRDPNVRQPRKIGGAQRLQEGDSQAPTTKLPPIPLELISASNEEGAPDLKELESNGLLPKFLRLWNNPAVLQQLKTVSALLRADGIDLKDEAAVKAWLEAYEGTTAQEKKPFVNPDSSVGRNDPCPCGSGKKFKKCCE